MASSWIKCLISWQPFQERLMKVYKKGKAIKFLHEKDFQDFKSVFCDFNFQSSSKKLLFSFLLFKCSLDLENDKVGLKKERYLDSPHDCRHNARYLRWDDFLSKWQFAELEKNSSNTSRVDKKSFGQLSFSSIGQISFLHLF